MCFFSSHIPGSSVDAQKIALGVLVTTPAHEGAMQKRRTGGTSTGRPQSQPDSVVAMTGLVTVNLPTERSMYTSTVRAVQAHLREKCLEGLVVDEPRRGSGTVLMYDQIKSTFAGDGDSPFARSTCCADYPFRFRILNDARRPTRENEFKIKRGRAKRHIQYNSPNPFDVNMKVMANSHIEIGDLVVASLKTDRTGALVGLKSQSPMLEVKSIKEVYIDEHCIVVGVATVTSERPDIAHSEVDTERRANQSRRRYIPVRVGGTVSINDTWKMLDFTDGDTGAYRALGAAATRLGRWPKSGVKYVHDSGDNDLGDLGDVTKEGVLDNSLQQLLQQRLQIFIQPLQVHTEAGFHARIGHVSW